MFEAVAKDFPDIKPERTLMIGDKYVKIFFSKTFYILLFAFFFFYSVPRLISYLEKIVV